jgi:hypothetical protein
MRCLRPGFPHHLMSSVYVHGVIHILKCDLTLLTPSGTNHWTTVAYSLTVLGVLVWLQVTQQQEAERLQKERYC